MKGLTVIATNNGFEYLEKSLEAEKKHGRWPVLVVDTHSLDPMFAPWAANLCKRFGVEFISMEKSNYDFGAYLTAYKLKKDFDAFWFKHDSLYLKSPRFYDVIEQELPKFGMIGWHFFAKWGSSFDNEEQRIWLVNNLGSDDYDYGFYGPNLAISRKTLDALYPDLEWINVDDKIKQQAMERGWAIIAKKNKLPVLFLEHYKGDVKSDAYEFFIKATHSSGSPRK